MSTTKIIKITSPKGNWRIEATGKETQTFSDPIPAMDYVFSLEDHQSYMVVTKNARDRLGSDYRMAQQQQGIKDA